ncbi:unnamed protein product [Miscanthus lutarioriparius]|uniref:Uncharacterized protein n=1 Tax=Miscanthus lutarioriparius TaxID=422564 RepID=A0A811NXT2_9POAL|nr:unnamed protein product [Miscanthus lutarioriparius]
MAPAPLPASARGLFRMPPPRLANRYFLVYASDNISPDMKPPPISDGTPNESVADVFVRVTQLMSMLETQYSGETVVIERLVINFVGLVQI